MSNAFKCEAVLEEYDVPIGRRGRLFVNNHTINSMYVRLRIEPYDNTRKSMEITVVAAELERAIVNAQNAHR